jgi:ADP-ribose pyrophosphatase
LTELLKTSRFSVEKIDYPGDPDRAVIRHPGAVVLLPILSDGRICLIRNYRVSIAQTLLELPAGTLEPGEPPLQTAHRELAEETGYTAGKMKLLRTFFPSPGILDEKMYLYLATQLMDGPPSREAGEQIENVVLSFEDAIALVDECKIVDAKTIVGLLLLQRDIDAGRSPS